MITENLSTLKIHKLTQAQYDREVEAGNIDPSAMYLTPDEETDPTVPAWAKAASKPTYAASEVGADASGTASSLVSAHNTATDAHSDIREEIVEVSSRIVSEVMTMTKELYDSMTKSQFAALYAQGVRIIAVEMSGDNSDSGDSGTATVINFVSISIDKDGNIYHGVGYKEGYRLNSSGGETSKEYSAVTGYIPVTAGDTIRVDNTEENVGNNGEVIEWYAQQPNYICAYDSNFNYICGCTPQDGGTVYGEQQLWTSMELIDGISVVQLADISNIAYIRVNICGLSKDGAVYGAAMFVTVNQAI